MNTQTPASSSGGGKWGIIIVVLVLLIGGFFLLRGKGGDSEQPGTLADIMARGGDWKCTWSVDAEEGASNGTVYVSGNKFASTITTATDAGSMTAQAISDGAFMYTWGDAMPTGVKIKLDGTDVPDVSSTGDVSGVEQLAGQYAYDCDPWSADAAVFTPPANITFTDFSAMMQELPQIPEFPDMPPQN